IQKLLGNEKLLNEKADKGYRRAVEMFNPSVDAMLGYHPYYQFAQTAALLGEVEMAVENLNLVLSAPVWISRNSVKLDPAFDRIREEPAFKELLAKPDVVF
ncbi:MAG: hypothetical protein IIB65_11040, partial [Proteobacteria bacterium]|nr:hypothetical protein [Pseudomonadota bacterium]